MAMTNVSVGMAEKKLYLLKMHILRSKIRNSFHQVINSVFRFSSILCHPPAN